MALNGITFSKGSTFLIEKNRKIYMNCQGQGSPTVLFISGYPDRGDASWETVIAAKGQTLFSTISKLTKACNYDRPGTIKIINNQLLKSRSEPVPQPVTAASQVDDLHALVKSAQINKPLILVAHSAGGLIARLYAFKYPEDVSGLILIDVTNEQLFKVWAKKEIEAFHFGGKTSSHELKQHYNDIEIIDFDTSFKQLEYYQSKKLAIPAVILTSDIVPNAQELIKAGSWPDFVTQNMAISIMKGISLSQKLIANTFIPKAKQIHVKSGHYIQKDHPQVIINLIHTMVEQQRATSGSAPTF